VLKTNARVAISENKPDAAYSLLSQVLATRPRDIETLELLKEVTLALGKTDEADICQQNLDQLKDMRQQYITLINDSTDNVSDTQVRLQLGELGYSFGEYSKAQAWFQKALLIDPSLQGQVDEKMKVLYDEIGMLVPLSDTDSQDTPDTADTPDESKEATESTPDSGDTPKADSPETATPDASTDAAPADPKPADPAPPADSDNPM
jgi:tetratricopeptide (TPR) repeat protein